MGPARWDGDRLWERAEGKAGWTVRALAPEDIAYARNAEKKQRMRRVFRVLL